MAKVFIIGQNSNFIKKIFFFTVLCSMGDLIP